MKDFKEVLKVTFGIAFLLGGLLLMSIPGLSWNNADIARICGAIFAGAGLITIFC